MISVRKIAITGSPNGPDLQSALESQYGYLHLKMITRVKVEHFGQIVVLSKKPNKCLRRRIAWLSSQNFGHGKQ